MTCDGRASVLDCAFRRLAALVRHRMPPGHRLPASGSRGGGESDTHATPSVYSSRSHYNWYQAASTRSLLRKSVFYEGKQPAQLSGQPAERMRAAGRRRRGAAQLSAVAQCAAIRLTAALRPQRRCSLFSPARLRAISQCSPCDPSRRACTYHCQDSQILTCRGHWRLRCRL